MPVLHLRQPSLYRRLVVLLAEQKLRGVPPLHVLQHPYPILHRRDAVGRQVIRLFARSYLERGSSLCPVYPAEGSRFFTEPVSSINARETKLSV